jgi:hypothetical protein
MDLLARRPCPRVARLLAILVTGFGLAACAHLMGGGPPAPRFGASIESVPRTTFLAYVERLEFVSDPHLSDEQPLIDSAISGQLRRVGPRARIEPEVRSTKITDEQLRDGRVIARIISDGTFEPLGIRRGIQYVWIDSSTGRWRAAIIPATATEPIRMLSASVRERPHLKIVPSALWYYGRWVGPGPVPPIGPQGQGSCGTRCCAFCALMPGLCDDVAEAMLRAEDFDGRPGLPHRLRH